MLVCLFPDFWHPGVGIRHEDNIRIKRLHEPEEILKHVPCLPGQPFRAFMNDLNIRAERRECRFIMNFNLNTVQVVREFWREAVIGLTATWEDPVLCHEVLVTAYIDIEELNIKFCLPFYYPQRHRDLHRLSSLEDPRRGCG